VRSDLTIGGYVYVKDIKLEILHREKRGYCKLTEIEVNKNALSVFPAE
jgi:hypothetical protein